VKATVSTTAFEMYAELNPSANSTCGITEFDCKNRFKSLHFYIAILGGSIPNGEMRYLEVKLVDSNNKVITYRWHPSGDKYTMSDKQVYYVEVPVGSRYRISPWIPNYSDIGFSWVFDDPSYSTFDWSKIRKVRICAIADLDPPATNITWGIEIDGFQFVGGYAITPDAEYSQIFSAIDKAWSYNANTGIWFDETTLVNDAGINDCLFPPIQSSVLGDAFYFGGDIPFKRLRVKTTTAGVYSGFTLQWQYYNGSWTPLNVRDMTDKLKKAGTNWLCFEFPSDWITTAVHGNTKYWIRCIVTAFNSPALTTEPKGDQAWVETGFNPPVFDPESIDKYGVHLLHLQDTLINSFEYAQREGERVLANLKNPIPQLEITIPAHTTIIHPSDLVTITIPQYNISAEEWRVMKVRYEWNSERKTVHQTLPLTQKTSPLPPIWSQMPELLPLLK
jgi:hypothetical protein